MSINPYQPPSCCIVRRKPVLWFAVTALVICMSTLLAANALASLCPPSWVENGSIASVLILTARDFIVRLSQYVR